MEWNLIPDLLKQRGISCFEFLYFLVFFGDGRFAEFPAQGDRGRLNFQPWVASAARVDEFEAFKKGRTEEVARIVRLQTEQFDNYRRQLGLSPAMLLGDFTSLSLNPAVCLNLALRCEVAENLSGLGFVKTRVFDAAVELCLGCPEYLQACAFLRHAHGGHIEEEAGRYYVR